MLGERPERRDRQEQEGADDHDGPESSPANVPVSSRSVPRPNGADFFAPRLAGHARWAR